MKKFITSGRQRIATIVAMFMLMILSVVMTASINAHYSATTNAGDSNVVSSSTTSISTTTTTTTTTTTPTTTTTTSSTTTSSTTTSTTTTTTQTTVTTTVTDAVTEVEIIENDVYLYDAIEAEGESKYMEYYDDIPDVVEQSYGYYEDGYTFSSGYVRGSAEYIMLCNAVAHEAGSYWITTEDKAKVVDVIMNRVYSSQYPGTVYDVLTQPSQFSGSSGYVNLGSLSSSVTDSVIDAVDGYLDGKWYWGYISFYGDGYQNYFS